MPRRFEHSVGILAAIEWDFTWQRHQALACELARQSTGVVFVESLPKRLPKLGEMGRIARRLVRSWSGPRGTVKVRQQRVPNLTLLSPVALPAVWSGFHWINRVLFLPRLAARIRRLIGPLPIVLNYLPTQSALDLCALLKPAFLVYDYTDRRQGDPRLPTSLLASHQAMLDAADLVVSPSSFLAAEAAQASETPTEIVPHGVDFDLFYQLDRGQPTTCVQRIGYFGGIGPFLDYDLLQVLGESFELLLVGPVRGNLPPLKNCTLRPLVPHTQVVDEIASCDAFVLPYKIDAYAQGISPIKLLECFATGRPVVGTAIPALKPHQDKMIIVKDGVQATECLLHLEQYEDEDKRRLRLAVARENSWHRATDQLLAEIQQLMQ